eukprot:NODE_28750_length_467_cov_2.552941.p1 GENE.NODE_28750_length_467_cov_2.552941~~NODE_28750_length_467_cov_2.552941.p1  ORF type:complete len:93 (-),score=45.72 NODE_28750_length_467_cov_2.552941:38-316(-)
MPRPSEGRLTLAACGAVAFMQGCVVRESACSGFCLLRGLSHHVHSCRKKKKKKKKKKTKKKKKNKKKKKYKQKKKKIYLWHSAYKKKKKTKK